MRAFVVARTRLSFRVGLHKESSEVGNQRIYLLRLRFPPCCNILVQRVGGLRFAQCHWRCEVDAQVNLDAIRAQQVSINLHRVEILLCEHLRRSVHVVQNCAVNAKRGISTGVSCDYLGVDGSCIPEDAVARISAFNRAVEVVPMIEKANAESRCGELREVLFHLPFTLSAQQVVCSVEYSDVCSRLDGYVVLCAFY